MTKDIKITISLEELEKGIKHLYPDPFSFLSGVNIPINLVAAFCAKKDKNIIEFIEELRTQHQKTEKKEQERSINERLDGLEEKLNALYHAYNN